MESGLGVGCVVSMSLPRFLLRAAGLTVAVSAVAWVLVGSLAGPHAQHVVPWAAGVTFLGALLGRLAGHFLVPSGRPESPAQAALVGLGVRLLSTAALSFAALQLGVSPARTFALVLAGLYLSLLVLEVVQAAADVRVATGEPTKPTHATPHDDGSGAAG